MSIRGGEREPERRIIKRKTATVGQRSAAPARSSSRRGVEPEPVIGATIRRTVERKTRTRDERDETPSIPRRTLFAAGAVLGGTALLAGAIWAYQSPFFHVQSVTVVGAERMTPEVVAEAAGVTGDSMFTADLTDATRRVYKLPLVDSARVERSWPHGVKVTINERKTWGTWEQGGVAYSIDRKGFVLGIGAAAEGLPVISSSQAGSHKQGDYVDYQAVEAAAEIYDKLPGLLGTGVKQVAFIAGQGVQVTTVDDQVALLGDSSSIAFKLATWAAMADQARVERISYTKIDLRYGNRPILQ